MGKHGREVKRGLQKAALWLLGFAWLGLVFAGMGVAFTPSPHSPTTGYALLVIAGIVAFVTVDRWAKLFPALLAYGILGSILSLVDGHALNHPEVPIPRSEGVAMVGLFSIATALSLTFAKRTLHLTDRVALLAFVVCFFWQAAVPHLMWPILSVGLFSLFVAWLYSHFRKHAGDSHSNSHVASAP